MVVLKFASKNNINNFLPSRFKKCDNFVWTQFVLHGLVDFNTVHLYTKLDGIVSALLIFGEQEKTQTQFKDGKSLIEKLTDPHVIRMLMQQWNHSGFELNITQQEIWSSQAKGMLTISQLNDSLVKTSNSIHRTCSTKVGDGA